MNWADFAQMTLDPIPRKDGKTPQEIRRHSINPSLDSKPVERALHIIRVGDEVQRITVIRSIPQLIFEDPTTCYTTIIPNMLQALSTGSSEYHLEASEIVLKLFQNSLMTVELFVQTFLQTIISSIDHRDPVAANAWLETLLGIVELLPQNIIQSQIWPIVLSRSAGIKPVTVRISSCRLLGAISKGCQDLEMLKRVVVPAVIGLCNDENENVRASMSLNLAAVMGRLGSRVTKVTLLPTIAELAADQTSLVKQSILTSLVEALPHFAQDMLQSILPLVKQLVNHAFKLDGQLLVTMANEYGRLCFGLKKAGLQPGEKEKFVSWYNTLAKLGVRRKTDERKLIETIPVYLQLAEMERILCRQYCAANFASVADFYKADSERGGLIEALHPLLSALTTDPYFMVRKTVASQFHQITLVYGEQGAFLVPELLTILKDEAGEVLEGLVPNLSSTIKQLTTIKVYKVGGTDTNLSNALMKCEHNLSLNNDWRTQKMFYKELQSLFTLFSSDFNYNNFVPLLFRRLKLARPIPVRLAIVETLSLLFLQLEKPQQKADVHSQIVKELCYSKNFYDRMLYLKSCNSLFAILSTTLFKEFFFTKTCQLVDDPVVNIRLALCKLLPYLKAMLKPSQDKKLNSILDETISRLSGESDGEILRQLNKFRTESGQFDFAKMFPEDPNMEDNDNLHKKAPVNKSSRSARPNVGPKFGSTLASATSVASTSSAKKPVVSPVNPKPSPR